MKKSSREFNVFSMSALDLFASALGAFILISIVLMPYFLHVDPEEINKLRRALAETQQNLQQARNDNADLAQQLQALIDAPTFQFPDLDIVIALDTTGSMRDQIEGLKSEIDQLIRVLLRLSPSLAVGIIDFKDRCEGANAVRASPLRQMDAATFNDLQAFADTMSAGGSTCNSDRPEALAKALETAIVSNWRSESESRVIVMITDNAAYEDRQAYALRRAGEFAADGPNSKVSVVFRGDEANLRGNEVDFLRDLANAGNGNFVHAGVSFTASIILALTS